MKKVVLIVVVLVLLAAGLSIGYLAIRGTPAGYDLEDWTSTVLTGATPVRRFDPRDPAIGDAYCTVEPGYSAIPCDPGSVATPDR